MTIQLITGKTGNGKSLLAIQQIEARRLEEGRDVYFNGISNLALPWIEFTDTKEWHKLPNGAIIVFDEAQSTFRPRPNGSAVPPHVAALEVHRKQGHDLYLITQQPSFLDTHVRKLTDTHQHLMRKFGAEKAVIHKWNTCKEDAHNNRSDSIKTEWDYPKDLYAVYKSADQHTIKKAVPFRYYLKFIIPVIVVALLAYAYWGLTKSSHIGSEVASGAKSLHNGLNPANNRPGRKEDDPNYWYEQQAPRIPTIPSSAPKYDKVTEAKYAPVPAACIATKTRCQCYTQQATKMTTEESFCRQIAANGYFVDFDPNGQQNGNAQVANPAPSKEPQTVPKA